jgi:hypothetical protein
MKTLTEYIPCLHKLFSKKLGFNEEDSDALEIVMIKLRHLKDDLPASDFNSYCAGLVWQYIELLQNNCLQLSTRLRELKNEKPG